MNLYEINKKLLHAKNEVALLVLLKDNYPAVGDMIRHKTEEKKFKKLTEQTFSTIEYYDEWRYFEVKKDNKWDIQSDMNTSLLYTRYKNCGGN